MRKKLINFLIITVVSISLSSCAKSKQADGEGLMTIVDNRFSYTVYVHDETGIMYLSSGSGGLCVMIDRQGKPLIYNEVEN